MARKKQNIVILGAGFGGLRAAFSVSRELRRYNLLHKYTVILLDRHEHHTYTPLLYEVATTSPEQAGILDLHNAATTDIGRITAATPVQFRRAEVTSFDPMTGVIRLKSKETIASDYTILSLGSEVNYFGIPGLEEYALELKTFRDAIMIRDTILDHNVGNKKEKKVVIGGGGATGVELAGELQNWCPEFTEKFNCRLKISILEAQSSVLPGLDPQVIRKAETRLKSLGVEIMTNAKIAELQKNQVVLMSKKKVPFDVFVWSGGVKTPDLLLKVPLKTENHGRIEANHEMLCLPQTPHLRIHSKTYGIGDNVCSYDPKTGKPVPAVARAAIRQATIAARNVMEDIKVAEGIIKHPAYNTYTTTDYPYIVPIGGKYAIAKVGPVVFSGRPAWMFKLLVELNYLLSIMPLSQALKKWSKALMIFMRNDRLG